MAKTPRPKILLGTTHTVLTGCGKMRVTVNWDFELNITEVFAKLGKSGGCATVHVNSLTMFVTQAIRYGMEIDAVVKRLRGERCQSPAHDDSEEILSCEDGIGIVIERVHKELAGIKDRKNKVANQKETTT